jgi:hypothetical protein
MQMQAKVRYPNLVRARVPRELSDAVDNTASARFLTRSEYVRSAHCRCLEHNRGLVLKRTHSPAAEPIH